MIGTTMIIGIRMIIGTVVGRVSTLLTIEMIIG